MNVLKKRKMYSFWGKFKYEGEDVYMRESCIYEREFVFMKAKMYSWKNENFDLWTNLY